MEKALDFALDVQQLLQQPDLTSEIAHKKFGELVAQYGATKRPDGVTLDFPDGSATRWSEQEQSWELLKKGQ